MHAVFDYGSGTEVGHLPGTWYLRNIDILSELLYALLYSCDKQKLIAVTNKNILGTFTVRRPKEQK